MKNEKYLPIGTVVMLKGGQKRAMITGFCSFEDDKKEKIYDYTGCLYPEGIISHKQILLFNHDQIEKIFHLGLVDDEEKQFKEKLNELVKNLINDKEKKDEEIVF